MGDADFPGWLRAAHFLNILWISLLIRSGLQILSAHPKLYWSDACRPETAWLRLIRKKMPKDRLWTSMDEEQPYSPWIALPGGHRLGLGRHWHFASVVFWIATGIIYVVLLLATGESHRLVPTSWTILPAAWQTLVTYLHFQLPPEGHPYNPLQQLAYFGVVFLLTPLTIASGAAMSPSIESRFPWFERMFLGRQGARSVHFLCFAAFIAFTLVHTAMVIVHGVGLEFAKMALGSKEASPSLAIVVGLIALAAVVAINAGVTLLSWRRPRSVQSWLGAILHRPQSAASEALQPRSRHRVHDGFFRVNGYPPVDHAYTKLAGDAFKDWRLEICGLVERPLSLSLSDLRRLSAREQVTKHTCIQGWTATAGWKGVQLSRLLDRCRPLPQAKHVALFAMDDKAQTAAEGEDAVGRFYETITLELARQEQTILAYEMNGAPLSIEHGAPLRLRVESQLGFKMVKWIDRIELIDDYGRIGLGQGGWREDHMYYSPAVAI
jgi:methionine sulfoxide reductase catalytic subunit